MKDFEQLYYDQLYKNKKLQIQIDILTQELEIYKSSSNKDIKKIIIDSLIKYKEDKSDRTTNSIQHSNDNSIL